MKYTFLLPAFKGRFLKEMLSSIQAQTYTDFKVIISDDCSPEDLRTICEPYLSDPRFSYRRNAENMGSKSLVAHWNLLVSMCDTEFLILASDDDVYSLTFLEEIDQLTIKYPNVDLFRGRVRIIDDNSNNVNKELDSEEIVDSIGFIYKWFSKVFFNCISNYCYRTERLKDEQGFKDFPLAWFSDDATNSLMASNGCGVTKNVVFSSRQSGLNISGQWGNKSDSEKKTLAAIIFYRWMEHYMDRLSDSSTKDATDQLWRAKVVRNIQNNIFNCTILKFFKYLYMCPTALSLNKARIAAHYLRIKMVSSR